MSDLAFDTLDLLSAPDDDTVMRAVEEYAHAVCALYGERVRGIYLFGSRARGDHTRDSDADVAIVLADGDWKPWAVRERLADLEYDAIVATGAEPQGWPVRELEWRRPEKHRNPELVRSMKRDARPLGAR